MSFDQDLLRVHIALGDIVSLSFDPDLLTVHVSIDDVVSLSFDSDLLRVHTSMADGGGWVWRRCRVSYVAGASN